MAGQIAVTPEQLRSISAKMKLGAEEVEAILSRLSSHVAPVRSEWTGPAKAYFNAFWDQSLQDGSDLRTVLDGMAALTETAAAAYEATEKSIAESFNQFRNGLDTASARADDVGDEEPASGAQATDTPGAQPLIGRLQGRTENEVAEAPEESESQETPTGSELCSEVAVDDSSADGDMTEVEDGPGEDIDPSTGPSKANGRLPWARFMAKSARPGARDVGGSKMPERRFKASDPALTPGSRLCRLCFTVVSLEPDLIEATATHDYVRCPHCGNSFPIRHGDVPAKELSQ